LCTADENAGVLSDGTFPVHDNADDTVSVSEESRDGKIAVNPSPSGVTTASQPREVDAAWSLSPEALGQEEVSTRAAVRVSASVFCLQQYQCGSVCMWYMHHVCMSVQVSVIMYVSSTVSLDIPIH
jgi:hypothetical protein